MILDRKIPRNLLNLHIVTTWALLDYIILSIYDFFFIHVVLRIGIIMIELIFNPVLAHCVILLSVLCLISSL